MIFEDLNMFSIDYKKEDVNSKLSNKFLTV